MSDCYSYHHFYYYYGCDSHYDSSSDLNSYDPNPRQINEITFWKKTQKWPTGMTREVTHGSDPRWVTSAPGGPKNLLIDHHNNNAAVARGARRKNTSFWPGDASEDASFHFIVFVSSERWTLGQGNSWVIPANAPRRPWILLPSRRPTRFFSSSSRFGPLVHSYDDLMIIKNLNITEEI